MLTTDGQIEGIDPARYTVTTASDGKDLDPDDYFLLRRSDLLAVATLRSYAQNALQMLEIDELHPFLSEPQRSHLLQLADDVSLLASDWGKSTKKVPD